MHTTCAPPILYFGTPVVVVSSLNEDGTTNLAPISSAWWLGWTCVLGFGVLVLTSMGQLGPEFLSSIPHPPAGFLTRIPHPTSA